MRSRTTPRHGFALALACFFALLLLAVWALVFSELKTLLLIEQAQATRVAYDGPLLAAFDLLETLPPDPQVNPPLTCRYPRDPDPDSPDGRSITYYKITFSRNEDGTWTINSSEFGPYEIKSSVVPMPVQFPSQP